MHEVRGRQRVEAVRLERIPAACETIACDALLMSGGWTPSVHLFSQSRGKLVFDEALASLQARHVGAARALRRRLQRRLSVSAEALAEGDAAGAKRRPRPASPRPKRRCLCRRRRAAAAGGGSSARRSHILGDRHAKAFVDFQNDVCVKDVELAVQEGMRSIEHIKRYTTTGMATDQGKLSNMNALAIAAAVQEKAMPEVGLTTFRPPYTPVTFGAFAGARPRRSLRSDPPHPDP